MPVGGDSSAVRRRDRRVAGTQTAADTEPPEDPCKATPRHHHEIETGARRDFRGQGLNILEKDGRARFPVCSAGEETDLNPVIRGRLTVSTAQRRVLSS